MNEIMNKFLLTGKKSMPEMDLRQPGFTQSACDPFIKNKERIKNPKETGGSRYFYQNELDKVCFEHDMVFRDFKDLNRRTAADRYSKQLKIDSVNLLYLIIIKVNRCFEEIKKSKYLTLVPINESQEKIKKYQKMWGKIRNLIRSVTKNSDDYDYELPLNKTIEIPRMKTVVRAVFYENKKLYPQVFLDECLYKL